MVRTTTPKVAKAKSSKVYVANTVDSSGHACIPSKGVNKVTPLMAKSLNKKSLWPNNGYISEDTVLQNYAHNKKLVNFLAAKRLKKPASGDMDIIDKPIVVKKKQKNIPIKDVIDKPKKEFRPSPATYFCFTINNYTPEVIKGLSTLVDQGQLTYICWSEEKGEKKGTPHLQGYLQSCRRKGLFFSQ